MSRHTPTRRFSRRLRRLRRVLVVTAASTVTLYVLAGLVFHLLVWAEIRRIRHDGDPTSLMQLVPAAPPDSENGAVIYQKAFRLMRQRNEFAALSNILYRQEVERNPKLWDQAEAELPNFVPVVEVASRAAQKPQCCFKVDWKRGYSPENPRIRRLADLLCAYALACAHTGDMDEAVRALMLAISVADTLRDDHTFISFYIRTNIYRKASDIAYEIAANRNVSENELRAVCNALAPDDLKREMPIMLKWERAMRSSDYDEIAKSGSPHWEESLPDCARIWRRFEYFWAGRPVLLADELLYLHTMRRIMKDADKPFRKLPKPEPTEQSCDYRPASPLLSEELVPALCQHRRNFDSSLARINRARLAIAACVYRNRFGTYPQSLADLAKLGWHLDTEDPFSGQDFIYRRQGESHLIYSVGPDLKDNKGRASSDYLVAEEGTDIVYEPLP